MEEGDHVRVTDLAPLYHSPPPISVMFYRCVVFVDGRTVHVEEGDDVRAQHPRLESLALPRMYWPSYLRTTVTRALCFVDGRTGTRGRR